MCHITASNNMVIFREWLDQNQRFSQHKYYFKIDEQLTMITVLDMRQFFAMIYNGDEPSAIHLIFQKTWRHKGFFY